MTDVVTSDVLRPMSSDLAARDQMESHVPPTSEPLETVLTSPQFQQAMGTFNAALQSGQLGPLMGQFGLGGQVVEAANTGSECKSSNFVSLSHFLSSPPLLPFC